VSKRQPVKALALKSMNDPVLLVGRRGFRAGLLLFAFWLAANSVSAAPCSQTSSQRDVWVTQKVDALIRAARALYENDKAQKAYERVVEDISATMKRCRMAEESAFVARYPEFVEYVKALSISQLSDHELGFIVPDKVYFAETSKYVAIPEFLLTPQFLRAVSRFETLPQAKALLREMNAGRSAGDQLLFFSYESRHLGTPDNRNSFRRLLIVVPGNAAQHLPEKWVQFGVPDPRARATVRNVSVVAAVPGPDQITNVYFKDYYRTYRRGGSITINGRWELGEGDDNCAQCHKSGILPIFPVSGSVSRDEKPMVEVVNERFLQYIPARFDKYLDTTTFGPGLGSTIRDELHAPVGVGKTIAGNTTACAACHQPNRLGPLNWPMDKTLISSFVRGGQMPLGSKLQNLERAQLYRKLVQEYFSTDDANPGVLKAWLLGSFSGRHSATSGQVRSAR
jgi:hypothetical protein